MSTESIGRVGVTFVRLPARACTYLGVTIVLNGTGEGRYDAPFEYVIGYA